MKKQHTLSAVVRLLSFKKLSGRSLALLSLVTLIGLSACEREYNLYDGGEYLQFGPEESRIYSSNYVLADTTKSFSFVYEVSELTQDTVYFDLYVVGGPKDYDRSFVLTQETVPGEMNAEAGVHYIGFDDPSVAGLYTVKAGVSHYLVPVVLLRDASLQEVTYVLKFKLESNENFQTGDTRLLWRKGYCSDQLIQPNKWTASMSKYYFGKYSKVKHRFMIDSTGQRWDDDFITALSKDYGLIKYWTAKLKLELLAYNTEHPDAPMVDEDGELIVFP